MPKLMGQADTVVQNTVSNFGFSAKRTDELTATEYTLTDIEVDLSPSTRPFVAQLTKALQTVSETLDKSPRSENLLVRVQTFDESLTEVHGFVNLVDVKPADYNLDCVGSGTALNDAALCGVEAVGAEGARLDGLDYGVNGLVIVITDGEENSSRTARSAKKVADAILRIQKEEHLESLKTILIGVGSSDATNPDDPDNATKTYLENFQREANFDQFVWIGKATPNSIAKMANFISRSVSSSSQALGTGGASKNLTF